MDNSTPFILSAGAIALGVLGFFSSKKINTNQQRQDKIEREILNDHIHAHNDRFEQRSELIDTVIDSVIFIKNLSKNIQDYNNPEIIAAKIQHLRTYWPVIKNQFEVCLEYIEPRLSDSGTNRLFNQNNDNHGLFLDTYDKYMSDFNNLKASLNPRSSQRNDASLTM